MKIWFFGGKENQLNASKWIKWQKLEGNQQEGKWMLRDEYHGERNKWKPKMKSSQKKDFEEE